ncbi:MAG: NYN domain-containing protein [Candidatus Hydrogenedentes bacterium]|nr:NYN domain-containing protein [Candidatus Hydrogenedentota bacterium]
MERHRALWLIDAGYLFQAQFSIDKNYRFDYKKLRRVVETDGEIWRAYYLNSTPDPANDIQNEFHSWLRSAPPRGPKIVTKLYQLKQLNIRSAYCLNCEAKVRVHGENCDTFEQCHLVKEQQKGIDVGITTLMLSLQDQYDSLLLSSGDGDLLDGVDYITQQGKRLELVVFDHGVSTDLQARADKIHWINDFADQVGRE